MPRAAVGRMTASIVSHRVAPIPYAAILSLGGTDTRASRLMAVMVGRIMMESTMTAGSTPGPVRVVPKKGTHPSFRLSQLHIGRIRGMTTKMPPQAVDDARYRRQKLDQVLEKQLDLSGSFPKNGMELQAEHLQDPEDELGEKAFAQKDGRRDAEGGADHERQAGV